MKRITLVFLVMVMLLSCTACGTVSTDNENADNVTTTQPTIVETEDDTTIITTTTTTTTKQVTTTTTNKIVTTTKKTTTTTEQNDHYVLNTETKKFHVPSCKRLPTKNREDVTMSRDEIINNGYSPCGICKP